jgi:hypothetical protein
LGRYWNQNFSFYLFSLNGLNFAWKKGYVRTSFCILCIGSKTQIFIECMTWACITFDVNAKWCWKKYTWVSPVNMLERPAYFQGWSWKCYIPLWLTCRWWWNTFSTAVVTDGTAQIHFLTTGKCTFCFWKLFTLLYKTLNSTPKSQLFKISHTHIFTKPLSK